MLGEQPGKLHKVWGRGVAASHHRVPRPHKTFLRERGRNEVRDSISGNTDQRARTIALVPKEGVRRN